MPYVVCTQNDDSAFEVSYCTFKSTNELVESYGPIIINIPMLRRAGGKPHMHYVGKHKTFSRNTLCPSFWLWWKPFQANIWSVVIIIGTLRICSSFVSPRMMLLDRGRKFCLYLTLFITQDTSYNIDSTHDFLNGVERKALFSRFHSVLRRRRAQFIH